jgi:hypothetical protein
MPAESSEHMINVHQIFVGSNISEIQRRIQHGKDFRWCPGVRISFEIEKLHIDKAYQMTLKRF